MIESGFTGTIRDKLVPSGIYCLKLNLAFTAGVADCWYSGPAGDLWSEHKFLQKIPPVVDPCKLLSPLQQLWLEGRHREGRNVAVIIGSPDGCLMLPGLTWKAPIPREEFKARMIKKKALVEQLRKLLGGTEQGS